MVSPLTVFWFQTDLRLSDNPGLKEAVKHRSVLPIYIFNDQASEAHKIGEASRWWLHHSLEHLNESLGQKLNFYCGDACSIFKKLLNCYPIEAVYWNRSYEPWHSQEEKKVAELLEERNIPYKNFNASLLWEPEVILKSDQKPYRVFTPFYRQALLQASSIRKLLPASRASTFFKEEQHASPLSDLSLLPKISWHKKLEPHWKIGEAAAQKKFSTFLNRGLLHYVEGRDYPAEPYCSSLSPHLHFGEISPHQVWYRLQEKRAYSLKKECDAFLRELGWREFCYYQLVHFPELSWKNFQSRFDQFPWKHDSKHLKAWQQGLTGYPIVDAGMRELWETGTMHNRVRMIVASFLTKNLLIDWREGAAWFWDCLVDADLASNSANWQWVAGCGVDAAPYFRIFNPILQAKKFDPEGSYIRKFIPELAPLPNKFLFEPWKTPQDLLTKGNIILGETYPLPIVDLQITREKALQTYHSL